MNLTALSHLFILLTSFQRYGGAYQLGSSVFQPLAGKIYRYFSTKASTCSIDLLSLEYTVTRSGASKSWSSSSLVVFPRLFRPLRAWLIALRSGSIVLHVHRGKNHCRHGLLGHRKWSIQHRRSHSASTGTSTFYGHQCWYWPVGFGAWSHSWWCFYRIPVVAMVYVLARFLRCFFFFFRGFVADGKRSRADQVSISTFLSALLSPRCSSFSKYRNWSLSRQHDKYWARWSSLWTSRDSYWLPLPPSWSY